MAIPIKLYWHQILISLILGILVGINVGEWRAHENFGPHWKKGGVKKHMVERFSKDLNLNSEQKKQVESIFEKQHPKMMALHDEMRPKFESLRKETQNEIKTLLTPDQQMKMDKITAETDEKMKKRREGFSMKSDHDGPPSPE